MKVSVKVDTRAFEAAMKRAKTDMKKATEVALNKTAGQAKRALQERMPRSFDRPTPFVLNSVIVNPARASLNRLEAEVKVKDRTTLGTLPTKVLNHHLEGGKRHRRTFEAALQYAGLMPRGWYAVTATGPASGARLDRYGNISTGQVIQMLSQLRVQMTGGFTRSLNAENTRKGANARRRAYGRAGGQFVALPKGRGKLKPGVYLVEARDFGAKLGLGRTDRIKPVLLFVPRVSYQARFPFEPIVRQVAKDHLTKNLADALAREYRIAARRQAGR